LSVALVWVTGNSGVGKSTVCALLKSLGELAFDADWEGYSH
jgi:dephospho-CoA kinase